MKEAQIQIDELKYQEMIIQMFVHICCTSSYTKNNANMNKIYVYSFQV